MRKGYHIVVGQMNGQKWNCVMATSADHTPAELGEHIAKLCEEFPRCTIEVDAVQPRVSYEQTMAATDDVTGAQHAILMERIAQDEEDAESRPIPYTA